MRRNIARGCLVFAIIMGVVGPAVSASSPSRFGEEAAAATAAMVTEPQTALKHAQTALSLAKALPPGQSHDAAVAQALELLGEGHTRNREPQQALPALTSALGYVVRAAPGTKLHAEILESLGGASSEMGRNHEALAYLQQSYEIYARLRNRHGRAKNLIEIGSIYSDAKDFDRALTYYDKAIDANDNDPLVALIAENNRGFALKNRGDFAGAEEAYLQARTAADALHSAYLKTNILANLAYVEAVEGRLAKARMHLKQARRLAVMDPESRSELPFLLGGEAKIAAIEGHLDRATTLLDQAFAGVSLDRTTSEFLDFHALAAEIYSKTNAFTKAFEHLKAFKRLDDQSNAMAASIGSQIAASRFDLETERARTAELKASKARSEVQSTGLILSLLAGFSLVVSGFMLASRERIRKNNIALEAALRTKTEFLSNINHELRTPLNGIIAPIEMLSHTALDDRQRLLAETIQSSADSLHAILQGILDVTDLSSGDLTMREDTFTPSAAIRAAAEAHRPAALAKGITFGVELEDDLGLVVGDEHRLRQALGCILSNAVKFTERGRITLRGFVEGGELVLSVTDTGMGFDPGKAERLFESFNQADNSMTRAYGGAGIGLSIARALVRRMGGELVADGQVGIGACFTLRLPVQQNRDTARDETPPEGLRVLLAEDNPANRRVVELILTAAGVSVTGVENGVEAVEAFKLGTYDLVLMDLQMPVMDGFEAIRAIRRLEVGSGLAIPILVLSANAHCEHVDAAKAAGGDHYLAKPVSAEALLRGIEQLLSRDPAGSRSLAA